jgi:hypothetical protein
MEYMRLCNKNLTTDLTDNTDFSFEISLVRVVCVVRGLFSFLKINTYDGVKRGFLGGVFLIIAATGWAQAAPGTAAKPARIVLSGTIDWAGGEINARAGLNLAAAGLRLPAGRLQGEEVLSDEYPHLFRDFLLSIPVDSGGAVADWIDRGDFSLAALDQISLEAGKIPPALSADLSVLTGRYTIKIGDLGAALTRHGQPGDIPRIINPRPAASYTSIIIIARDKLPVQGRKSSARQRLRRGIGLLRVSPISIPSTSLTITVTKTKRNVKRQAIQKVSSRKNFR